MVGQQLKSGQSLALLQAHSYGEDTQQPGADKSFCVSLCMCLWNESLISKGTVEGPQHLLNLWCKFLNMEA